MRAYEQLVYVLTIAHIDPTLKCAHKQYDEVHTPHHVNKILGIG